MHYPDMQFCLQKVIVWSRSEHMPLCTVAFVMLEVLAEAQMTCRPHAAESADHGELGFDSSLMDLVAEVEQMVTCNMHASGQASVHSSRSSVLSPMLTTRSLGCQQQALAQQPTYNLAAASVQVRYCLIHLLCCFRINR